MLEEGYIGVVVVVCGRDNDDRVGGSGVVAANGP